MCVILEDVCFCSNSYMFCIFFFFFGEEGVCMRGFNHAVGKFVGECEFDSFVAIL